MRASSVAVSARPSDQRLQHVGARGIAGECRDLGEEGGAGHRIDLLHRRAILHRHKARCFGHRRNVRSGGRAGWRHDEHPTRIHPFRRGRRYRRARPHRPAAALVAAGPHEARASPAGRPPSRRHRPLGEGAPARVCQVVLAGIAAVGRRGPLPWRTLVMRRGYHTSTRGYLPFRPRRESIGPRSAIREASHEASAPRHPAGQGPVALEAGLRRRRRGDGASGHRPGARRCQRGSDHDGDQPVALARRLRQDGRPLREGDREPYRARCPALRRQHREAAQLGALQRGPLRPPADECQLVRRDVFRRISDADPGHRPGLQARSRHLQLRRFRSISIRRRRP